MTYLPSTSGLKQSIVRSAGWLLLRKLVMQLLGQANGCGRPHERPTFGGQRGRQVEIRKGEEGDDSRHPSNSIRAW